MNLRKVGKGNLPNVSNRKHHLTDSVPGMIERALKTGKATNRKTKRAMKSIIRKAK